MKSILYPVKIIRPGKRSKTITEKELRKRHWKDWDCEIAKQMRMRHIISKEEMGRL